MIAEDDDAKHCLRWVNKKRRRRMLTYVGPTTNVVHAVSAILYKMHTTDGVASLGYAGRGFKDRFFDRTIKRIANLTGQ